MQIIATDDDFRLAVEKVPLRAEDTVQDIDKEGRLLNQWSLWTSLDSKNVGPECKEVLRQLIKKFVPRIRDECSRERRHFIPQHQPKLGWLSKGFVARDQVIVIVITRKPEYSKHFTKEPLPLQPDHATTNPTEIEEAPANHQQTASKQTTESTPIKQTPSTTIPFEKLEEQCYGVVMDSNLEPHPLKIPVGDILVIHDGEGVVLKTGIFGGIFVELKGVDGDATPSN
ncbi:hypothetical protein Z517_05066 [Fonsecaea pedrosoi CBS 271.37]|uniref:Uncharacterized protein n=1 Tax=Fonsecaea pedrosoi CBS 271.37 TaxID=1442368 RepID=A0A0D2HBZ4_9EURO|nr:uncharacterized protein Z517_05066 [Fonsecaea pedrosoi CBS 271.37]KIW82039.1 hypothetical protein Z517_05066 [Fonsecaea pedrosoi CBS 271.37]